MSMELTPSTIVGMRWDRTEEEPVLVNQDGVVVRSAAIHHEAFEAPPSAPAFVACAFSSARALQVSWTMHCAPRRIRWLPKDGQPRRMNTNCQNTFVPRLLPRRCMVQLLLRRQKGACQEDLKAPTAPRASHATAPISRHKRKFTTSNVASVVSMPAVAQPGSTSPLLPQPRGVDLLHTRIIDEESLASALNKWSHRTPPKHKDDDHVRGGLFD